MLGMPSVKQIAWIAVIALIAVAVVAYFSAKYRDSLAGNNPFQS
jgi:heme/copper-type cytochrome/quinol oxidase subunit 2